MSSRGGGLPATEPPDHESPSDDGAVELQIIHHRAVDDVALQWQTLSRQVRVARMSRV